MAQNLFCPLFPESLFQNLTKEKDLPERFFSFSSSLWSQVAEEIVELGSTTLVPSARHLHASQIGKRMKSAPGA